MKRQGTPAALSKAGRLVARGEREGVPIKLFEAASADHAELIRAVSQLPDIAKHFPSIHSVHGAFIVSAWVPSAKWRSVSLDALVALQLRIHNISVAGLPRSGFDYWRSLIRPRFKRAADLMREDELAEKITLQVDIAWDKSSQCLMHPDLTPANVVLAEHGECQIIDNELLTIGGLPLLDVCNTAYSLGAKRGQKYIDVYLEKAGRTFVCTDLAALRAAWLARRVGSAFVAGDLQCASALVRQYKSAKNIFPFDLTNR